MPTLNRQILLQTLDGYAEANRFSDGERRARLRQRTDRESLAIFAELYQTWEHSGQGESSQTSQLAQSRLEHHINVRQAFEKLAIRRGYESTF